MARMYRNLVPFPMDRGGEGEALGEPRWLKLSQSEYAPTYGLVSPRLLVGGLFALEQEFGLLLVPRDDLPALVAEIVDQLHEIRQIPGLMPPDREVPHVLDALVFESPHGVP